MKKSIKRYQKSFAKYFNKRNEKQQKYLDKNAISGDFKINSKDHPNYFKIDEEWDFMRKIFDDPILEKAKYKIGDRLWFIKTNIYCGVGYDKKIITKKILSCGIVTDIKTSDAGTGEILYLFKKLEPPCPESNPSVLEKDVMEVEIQNDLML
jgi:hypothetical protein